MPSIPVEARSDNPEAEVNPCIPLPPHRPLPVVGWVSFLETRLVAGVSGLLVLDDRRAIYAFSDISQQF